MAKVGDIYKGGDFLVTEDLKGKLLQDAIASAEVQTIGDQTKILLTFAENDKTFPLNSTNAKTLTKLFGSDDTDDWIGQTIILRPDVTLFAGKQVGCIRVDVVAMGQLESMTSETSAELSEDAEAANA